MSLDPRTNTVDGVLRRSAAKYPDRVAVVFEDRTRTYRELDDAVTRVAPTCSVWGSNTATASRHTEPTPTPMQSDFLPVHEQVWCMFRSITH